MKLTNGFDISASALTANRMRMDVISSNVANAETTRGSFVNGEYVPYKRKMVVMDSKESSFASILNNTLNGKQESKLLNGVNVTKIIEDTSPTKLVYNPAHPDANADGYVNMPNVDIATEMVDMIAAVRAYESNVTALNATKSMFMKALEIGK
ncbi:MAG: flagellar basal body rod protein FlgC [Candidatus Pristimantibacillus lignocellulolyticus]|uniref:Flagellar basal-body rod protein FlgC n=1 Tax=Candidatus Pristimantibacillus lignocellulolyticus TaxID=2994561 RepID=A0A9J6ZBG2_9BACL|nr:MAG: flagellar basal body rod protein FlgC [Candidatus Pristimantibacillus lignocellulolyticus]